MAYLIKVNQVNRKYTIKRVERKIVIQRSGRRGLPGQGVPTGGTTGQVLKKISNADYAAEWGTGAGAVDSVNGQTGVVVLDKGDIGLGNVDNTSDLNKPISTATQTALNLKEDTANKGIALGYASLDAGGKVPVAQLPASVMTYLGTWDAATNTPTLANGTGDAGDLYICSVAGTVNFGAGNISFEVGDWVMYNGSIWQRSDMSDAVSSVFGRLGAVVAANGDYTASQVTNVAAGNIAAVTVQAAIDELDTEKVAKAGDTMTGLLTSTYSVNLGFGQQRVSQNWQWGVAANGNYAVYSATSGSTVLTSTSGGLVNIGSSGTATHTLTLPSTATGIVLYNTADQTTNYERVRQYWSSNVFIMGSESGGTGTVRQIKLANSIPTFQYLAINNDVTLGTIQSFSTTSSASGIIHRINGTLNSTSGTQTGLLINPVISQSSTAGYTALLVNPTESTTGSGTKLLADFQVGGVSQVKISNAGAVTAPLVINTSNAVAVSAGAATVPVTRQLTTVTNNAASAVTITIATAGAVDGQKLIVRFYDFSAAAQTITWANTENSAVSAPTTSNGSTTLPLTVGFQYNSATSKWRCLAVA